MEVLIFFFLFFFIILILELLIIFLLIIILLIFNIYILEILLIFLFNENYIIFVNGRKDFILLGLQLIFLLLLTHRWWYMKLLNRRFLSFVNFRLVFHLFKHFVRCHFMFQSFCLSQQRNLLVLQTIDINYLFALILHDYISIAAISLVKSLRILKNWLWWSLWWGLLILW